MLTWPSVIGYLAIQVERSDAKVLFSCRKDTFCIQKYK